MRNTNWVERAASVAFAVLGFAITAYTAFPGWMSNDSLIQYTEATTGHFNDWHPVFLAWWWSKLLWLWNGPHILFLQLQVCYWLSWYLLADGFRVRGAKLAFLIPLVGLWPGLSFPLGHVWKDIFFATHMFLAWAILLRLCLMGVPASWRHGLAVLILAAFAVGSKTNGVVALPFMFGFYLFQSGRTSPLKLGVVAPAMTVVAFVLPSVMMVGAKITHTPTMQYIQSYDVLAASVASGQNLLPEYITEKVGDTSPTSRRLYWVGSNNLMYYNTAGDLTTTDPGELDQLQEAWVSAIIEYPVVYLRHRLENFASLLRIGEGSAAYVAEPEIPANRFGMTFVPNVLSSALDSTVQLIPWAYFPWIYLLIGSGAMVFLLVTRKHVVPGLAIFGSAVAFVLPHFLVTPSSDFRYLYYAYVCCIVVALLAAVPAEPRNGTAAKQ